MVNDTLAAELDRLIKDFHDGLPDGQGETGDGGVAGKALCQFVYDRADDIAKALRHPVPADLAAELDAVIEDRARQICTTLGLDPDEVLDEYGPVHRYDIVAYYIGMTTPSKPCPPHSPMKWRRGDD